MPRLEFAGSEAGYSPGEQLRRPAGGVQYLREVTCRRPRFSISNAALISCRLTSDITKADLAATRTTLALQDPGGTE